MAFSQEELIRYSRQLPVIGLDGQGRLQQARVFIVGAGGLGCPVLQYLVAAGVGSITVADGDVVELSNLHRQILFHEEDLGKNKAETAIHRLQGLNSNVRLHAVAERIEEKNGEQWIQAQQLVVDASDNFNTRYLLNRLCRKYGIPLVSASIYQFEAQVSVFNYHQGPCYECLYPSPPPEEFIPNCAEGGVLGVLPAVAGSLQAVEVIKILSGKGEVLSGRLLTFDLLTHHYRLFFIEKRPECQALACAPSRIEPVKKPVQQVASITAKQLAKALAQKPENYFLLDVRQAYEREIYHIGGSLIPLAELEQHLADIPHHKTIVVYCKKGARSLTAAQQLQHHDFHDILVLEGGVLSWSKEIDGKTIDY